VNEKRAALGKKRAAPREKHRKKERRDTMGSSDTSDESKNAAQGSGDVSSEVTREAQVVVAGSAPSPGDTATAGGVGAKGASPAPSATPESSVDAVTSAILAMSDLKQDIEAMAVSAELSVQTAIASSGQTDTDLAKALGARSE